MKKTYLINIEIYLEIEVIEQGYVSILNEKIHSFGKMAGIQLEPTAVVIDFKNEAKLIPGLIDVHIHGAAGADVMDGTKESLLTLASYLPSEGTTSFLATTMTHTEEAIEQSLGTIAEYMNIQKPEDGAEMLGVHLEGPFISESHAGAQPAIAIMAPEVPLFKRWQTISGNQIKLVTLAPEKAGATELIRYLKDTDVVASVGHSNARYEEVVAEVENGLSHVTHLYNAMSGFHHREPGVVGAAFLHPNLMVEVIADGIHVHPQAIDMAYQQKGKDGIILITDSIRAKSLEDGVYLLGGQDVYVHGKKATLKDGTLAGSTLRMRDAIANFMEFTGCSLQESVQMASLNPAKQLGLDHLKGSIAEGKDADLVVLDNRNEVRMTICRGMVVFQRDKDGEIY
ncbi:N-acetylglucosamine-6-phosphate deacetylase [Bacillus suaedae]|uniref:N-acetylglucosamine-6-phosphate deacetylase n=1 Tax=Halalkalibacter suaedae TaxID=2822140 RepID=UPI003211AAA1